MPTMIVGGSKFGVYQGRNVTFRNEDLDNDSFELTVDRIGKALDGEYQMVGRESRLRYLFSSWLGINVRVFEQAKLIWEGFVIAMTLDNQFERERISYDGLYNAVGATVVNLVENPSFENLLDNWVVATSGTSSAIVLATSANSPNAVRLFSGAGMPPNEATVSQGIDVIPSTNYRLRFQTRGHPGGGFPGRFAVFDITNSVSLIDEETGIDEDEYRTKTFEFSTSPTTVRIRIRLKSPTAANKNAYFDDVSFCRLKEGEVQKTFIPFTENQNSIDRYGRIEKVIEFKDKSPLEAIEARNNFLLKHSQPKVTSPIDSSFVEANIISENLFQSGDVAVAQADTEANLLIEFSGYFTVAYWKVLLPKDYRETFTRSELLTDLISTTTYLTPSRISSDLTIVSPPKDYITVGDAITELLEDDTQFKLIVSDFLVLYELLPTQKIYKKRNIYVPVGGTNKTVNPFLIESGLTVVNLNLPVRNQHQGSYSIANREYVVTRWAIRINQLKAEKTLQDE